MKRLFRRRPRPAPDWLPGLGWPEFSANCLLTGRTGGGKSTILRRVIEAAAGQGFGMFLNAPKPSDGPALLALLAACGRRDVAVFRPSSPASVNVLDAARPDLDAASLAVADAGLLSDVFAALSRQGDAGGGGDSKHWVAGGENAVRQACHLIRLAGERLTPDRVRQAIVMSAATPGALREPQWRAGENARLLELAHARCAGTAGGAGFRRCADYWTLERPSYPDRQWAGYAGHVLTPLSLLCTGEVERLLGAEEPTVDLAAWVAGGGVVFVDMSQPAYGALSVAVTRAVLSAAQRVCLAREVTPATRPFLFLLDEFPLVVAPADADFLSLSRSSLAPTVAVAQGVESLRKALPADSDAAVESIVGNTGLQIHCSPTSATAQWICERLGSELRPLFSGSTPSNSYADPSSLFSQGGQGAASWSQSVVRVLEPGDIRLRTGTAAEDGCVDAIVTGPVHCRPYRVITHRRTS